MFGLPPFPGWDGLHPLVVHFPVALLLVAPLFVLVGLAWRRNRTAFMAAALVLMALGTIATYVAVPTGEAAAKLAERTPEINAVIERHEDLAETSRMVFTALTVVFAALVLAPVALRREPGEFATIGLALLFLAVYGAGTLVLANTAHNGGRLVHELGVRSIMPAAPLPAAEAEKD